MKLKGKAALIDRLIDRGKLTVDEISDTAKHKPVKDAVKASQAEKAAKRAEKAEKGKGV